MFDKPSFYVHLGAQGKRLVSNSIEMGYANGAILSPVDFDASENRGIAKEVRQRGGNVLFDPQFYNPRADKECLKSHAYFGDYAGPQSHGHFSSNTGFETSMLEDEKELREFCKALIAYQADLTDDGVDAFISPSRHLTSLSSATLRNWKELNETFVKVARDNYPEKPILLSLPTDAQPLSDSSQPGQLLNYATSFDVEGFYLAYSVNEYYQYPLTGKEKVEPYITLIKHLKENRYSVVAAHSHHNAHILFGAGVDAFASGHNKNLKTFDATRFEDTAPSGGRRVFNYYSEPLLNELRVSTPTTSGDDQEEDDSDSTDVGAYSDLDLMKAQNFDLSKVRCASSPHDEPIFETDGLPSEASWSLRDGEWIHYMWACGQIAKRYAEVAPSSDSEPEKIQKRLEFAKSRINEAEELFEEIEEEGILLSEPEERIYSDWSDCLDSISD